MAVTEKAFPTYFQRLQFSQVVCYLAGTAVCSLAPWKVLCPMSWNRDSNTSAVGHLAFEHYRAEEMVGPQLLCKAPHPLVQVGRAGPEREAMFIES